MNFAPPNQYQAEQERISREEALAQAMQQQASQGLPAGQMAGQYYVPTNPLQHLAQALKGYGATKRTEKAQADRTALGEKYQGDSSADMAMLAKAMQGQQAIPQPADELGGGPGRPAMSPQESLAAALGGLKTPQGQQLGMSQYMAQIQRDQAEPQRVDLGDRIGLLKNGQLVGFLPKGITPDTQAKEKGAADRHAAPSGSAQLGAQTTLQTHATPSASARLTDERARTEGALNRGVTVRGQNLTNDRAVDANDNRGVDRKAAEVTSLRKEFDDAPEVKGYRTVLPIIESARNAPNTPAGDLDLIYAVGKVLDPTSVVREGEMALVIKSGSPMERFKGQVQYITQGKGRLTEVQRRELTEMLGNRVGQLEKNYNSAKSVYERAATARGLPFDQIFRESVEGNTPAYGRRNGDKLKQNPDGTYTYAGNG